MGMSQTKSLGKLVQDLIAGLVDFINPPRPVPVKVRPRPRR